MDPITTANQVHERMLDLQKTANDIHQERALRSSPTVEAQAAPTPRAVEARRSTAKAGNCSPAEPAI
jgi:hypothetical protein